MIPPAPNRLCLIGVLVALVGSAAFARGVDVRVTRIDGTALRGEWMGLEAAPGSAVLLATERDRRSVRLEEISSVAVVGTTARDAFADVGKGPSQVLFHLADGARLSGRIVGWGDDAVLARTIVAEETRLPLDRLAGVQWFTADAFRRANELFLAALRDRLPGQDVLISADAEEPKILRGRLERLDPESGTFVFGGQSRTFPTSKVFGVVLAAGASKSVPAGARLQLSDGSSVAGRMVGGGQESIRLETSFGQTTDFPWSSIQRIEFRSDRVTYLSDLEPVEERFEGRLHRAWTMRRDQSVGGGPLAIAGRRFEKGLGVHSFSEVSFDIGPEYESFAATIGLDDLVRPRGSVVFRVLGDGKVLFESELLNGRDEPKDIVVALRGVRRLSLGVDFGDDLDLSDHADWGGARLLKSSVQ